MINTCDQAHELHERVDSGWLQLIQSNGTQSGLMPDKVGQPPGHLLESKELRAPSNQRTMEVLREELGFLGNYLR